MKGEVMMKRVLKWSIGLNVILAVWGVWLAIGRVNVISPVTTGGKDEPMAWDAHRRISEIADSLRAQRWLVFVATMMALVCAVAALQAWDYARRARSEDSK